MIWEICVVIVNIVLIFLPEIHLHNFWEKRPLYTRDAFHKITGNLRPPVVTKGDVSSPPRRQVSLCVYVTIM